MARKHPKRNWRNLNVRVRTADADTLFEHYGSWGEVRAAVRDCVERKAAKVRLLKELHNG